MAEEGWLAPLIRELKDLRIPHRVSISIALIGAIFWVLTLATDVLGISAAIQSWRPWTLLAAFGGTITFLVGLGADVIEGRREKRNAEYARVKELQKSQAESAERVKFLHTMTPGERGACREFVAQNHRVRSYAPTGPVLELLRRGVLTRVSTNFSHMHEFSMEDWAWDYLRGHPELLDGTPPTSLVKPGS